MAGIIIEKLGASAVRWFEGFGWFFSIRRQMMIDGKEPMPLDPAKPITITLRNSFCNPGIPMPQQATTPRLQLFGLSYKDVEQGVRRQFTKMFSPYGFDAKRDITGIVSNRWGQACVVSPPGFYYGRHGQPAPSDIIRKPFARVAFAYAELTGPSCGLPRRRKASGRRNRSWI